ncbi:MAG: hypothetical protein GTO55_04865 [Armatimonadetes bacterium]|nr:hypothetical protein [Armatimonadota bacterium]NIM23598.1 hypothetical protein [Armatimonadota bacterium]NIM67464.1 hypothetical protein [Armatimonadota bacterium]NIM75961.1 hypothetical protein [Armatimonadota bacterium]NIN05650.1 hypothetical protein [Armatimonadota bacterium]
MRVRISPIIREALVSVGPLEDFDEALLRALKARHPDQAAALLSAITRLVEIESQRANEDKQQTLRRLADRDPGPEVVLRTSGGETPGTTTTIERQTIRIGDKEYHSLDEVPPHIRRAIEEAKSGKTTRKPIPRVGCTWALLGGWIFTFFRNLSR